MGEWSQYPEKNPSAAARRLAEQVDAVAYQRRLGENLEAFDPRSVRYDEVARSAIFAAPEAS